MYKVYEIKKRIFDDNDQEADKVRKELKENGTFLINLMSSPGGGKTTTLKRTIRALQDEMRIGVMEADIDSAVDADAISGNLVCPAEFDTGAVKNVMILSVPEGDDYPLMFQVSHCLLINKIDAASCFDFDFDACRERVLRLNPDMKIIPVSAKTGEGMDEWYDWIREQVKEWKEADK